MIMFVQSEIDLPEFVVLLSQNKQMFGWMNDFCSKIIGLLSTHKFVIAL